MSADFHRGQRIRVVQRGRLNGEPKTVEFYAVITYLDTHRVEYEGDGHQGGFALDAPHIGKMTTYGGVFLVDD